MTVEYVRDTYYNIKVFHVVVFALKRYYVSNVTFFYCHFVTSDRGNKTTW